ncbi:outer membrane beta-barrel protein [Arenibacter sp. 6A1]|uniref:outer membrane beta-barrel family protein n=1 Tax=Arenibacter sp. 6A1 TaxID=2720391 RepID=UPI0014479394|nr:outer membrane beta-barrel family protein [Arenibacter sp. 6A1]NKI27946.1 outer membrane beta-barrel protein [Arenibacter sp. 6A1]
MPKNILTLIFLWLSPLTVFGQLYKVSGKVQNEHNEPVPFANVYLQKVSDSMLVSGTSADHNGDFILQNIPPNAYFVSVSYVSEKSDFLPLEVNEDVSIGPLIIGDQTKYLNEVVLKAPSVKRLSDRMVFQVENTNLSQSSAFSILSKTPGVIVIGDKITIKNSPTLIYINGKRVYLSNTELKDLLENYAGENINSIELITNPSAKYDAEGGAILNIVASKNLSIGYKGEVGSKITQATYSKYEFNTSHYYKNEVVNAFASYSYNPKKNYKKDESYINFFDGNLPDFRRETDFSSISKSYAHNFNAIIDFKLNDNNHLSLAANLLNSPNKDNNNTVTARDLDQQGLLQSYFNSFNDLKNDNSNVSLNVDYGLKLGENGGDLKVISNYIDYRDHQFQDLTTDYYDEDGTLIDQNNFNVWNKQNYRIGTGQIDYSVAQGNNQLELGSKYADIKSRSSVRYKGTSLPDDIADDIFSYDEKIYAAYANIGNQWDPWSLVFGLRGEYIQIKAKSISLGNLHKDNYFKLFPTMNLQYGLGTDHIFGISYKKAIERPRYQNLNPFRYFLNESQYNTGNPTLKPSIENKITLEYTYNAKYIFSFYYEHINKHLEELILQDNINKTLNSSDYNIEGSSQYSADFIFFDYIKDWWYISTYMSGFYFENSYLSRGNTGVVQKNSTLGYLGQFYNQFTLSKDQSFTVDLSLMYLSDYIMGEHKFKNQFTADLSFRKSFYKKRVYVNLELHDIFNTTNIPVFTKNGNQDNGFISMPESRSISLGVRYKFGNYRLVDNHRDISPEELERLKEKSKL